jgi:hypothetical protein
MAGWTIRMWFRYYENWWAKLSSCGCRRARHPAKVRRLKGIPLACVTRCGRVCRQYPPNWAINSNQCPLAQHHLHGMATPSTMVTSPVYGTCFLKRCEISEQRLVLA